MNRRSFLKTAALVVPVSTVPAWIPVGGCASPTAVPSDSSDGLEFRPIKGSTDDAIRLPRGYRYDVVARWGDSLWSDAKSLNPKAVAAGDLLKSHAADEQARQFGFNCDAIQYFPIDEDGREAGILCVNHEFTSGWMMFPGWSAAMVGDQISEDYVRTNPQTVPYAKASHGVSIFEVENTADGWRLVTDSRFNRRITADTEIEIAGPAAGYALMKTKADPTGTKVFGTLGNCGGGKTPWGTYLTAEEYIDYYFGNAQAYLDNPAHDPKLLAIHQRLPMHEKDSFYNWHCIDERFDVARNPTEACRFGWIVEIDPHDPDSVPKKRTALGRFKHEAATCHIAKDGQAVVYTGDDESFEYVYKFVSRDRFDPSDRRHNANLLDNGTLYVARFHDDGSGVWLPLEFDLQSPLNPAAGFESQADILVNARSAADILHATPMDRPEDLGVNPVTGHVYIVCTRNESRTLEVDSGMNPNSANPRPRNSWGHIIEIVEDEDNHAGSSFRWEIFLLAGDPRAETGRLLTSVDQLQPGDLSRDDTYYAGYDRARRLAPLGSPDNIGFDLRGNLWIVTDGSQPRGANNGAFVCPSAGGNRGYLRQFMSGPIDAEICGCEFTPDGNTLFLSVQHPGDGGDVAAPTSDWPDGKGSLPRPSIIAITKKKGDPTIGS